jgi:hypothetical protein
MEGASGANRARYRELPLMCSKISTGVGWDGPAHTGRPRESWCLFEAPQRAEKKIVTNRKTRNNTADEPGFLCGACAIYKCGFEACNR